MPVIQERIKPTVHVRCAEGARRRYCGSSSTAWKRRAFPGRPRPGRATPCPWPGEAARSSRLEVGIGLDRQALVLHYSKLEREQPLFRIPANSGMETVRALGANAARLVKKLPLKALDRR